MAFSLFAYRVLPLITFPHELQYGEAVLVGQSERVWAEPGLYPPFDERIKS